MGIGRRLLSHWGLALGLLVAGCAAPGDTLGQWEGPTSLAKTQVAPWTYGEEPAKLLETEHYHLYTTIQDDQTLDLLPQIMEGALSMYHEIAPEVPISKQPLDCYIFKVRSEWDRFTTIHAGQDARVYLQIRSGGYTIHDRYVAYYIGRLGTFSVAAHEGWHQFAGRHFKGRLPPFFEEGIACMFETISWKDRLPRWNISVNSPRAQTLRKAIEGKYLWSLDQLCSMHAGDIVGESNEKIDAFYAQAWAFARFLWEGDGDKYRPAMQKWLAETADGTVWDPTGSHRRAYAPWNRRAARPMLEHYLGIDFAQIDKAYQAYEKRIAYEEFNAQLRANAQ